MADEVCPHCGSGANFYNDGGGVWFDCLTHVVGGEVTDRGRACVTIQQVTAERDALHREVEAWENESAALPEDVSIGEYVATTQSRMNALREALEAYRKGDEWRALRGPGDRETVRAYASARRLRERAMGE